MVDGAWIGPKEVRRSQARNQSLCGKRLSRFRGRPGDPDLLCNSCRRISSGGDEVQPVLTQLSTQMEELGTVSDQDYEVQFLPLGSLTVDMEDLGDGGRLQRPIQNGWVKKIAVDFSWARFNRRPPIVSERPDGTRHVIDGQHQTAAARAAGYGPETLVRCHVYRNLTRQQAATMFREENRDRKSVKPIDVFRARIAEGEPVAVAINSLLRSHGWQIGSHGKTGRFAAVMTLEAIYKQKDGEVTCGNTLRVITDAWDHSPESSHSTVVKVVGLFLRQYPGADLARFAAILRREASLQPYRIQMMPQENRKSWQETSVVALRERYNNRLDPSRRLT
jgi:ribosomal protein L21E